jgi:hypothetical protein
VATRTEQQLSPYLVRGWLAAYALAVAGGWLTADYVGARVLSILAPGAYGVLTGAVAIWLGRTHAWTLVVPTVTASAGSALLAFKAFGVPYGATGRWLPPVIAAVVGATLGVLAVGGPRPAPSDD